MPGLSIFDQKEILNDSVISISFPDSKNSMILSISYPFVVKGPVIPVVVRIVGWIVTGIISSVFIVKHCDLDPFTLDRL